MVAAATVAFELLTLAAIRWRVFHTGFLSSFASITVEAVNELGLDEGSQVTSVIKASDVMLATD